MKQSQQQGTFGELHLKYVYPTKAGNLKNAIKMKIRKISSEKILEFLHLQKRSDLLQYEFTTVSSAEQQ